MKKKVKKIPKFAEGFDWLNAAGIAAAATKPIANAFGIELGTASEIANAVGDVTALIPGVGPFISAGIKTFGHFAGGIGGTDGMGNATKATGLTRWLGLGRSDHSVLSQANREKNAINAKTQTQHLLSDYYNKQNVPTGGTILAAEGGIMNDYVMAAVSPGELEIDPVTLEYYEYPGDNGKPNSKDNIEKPIKKGKMIASHAEHMKMDNGKTPADNSKMVLDSKMPKEMKRKMIKKIFNWQEANKTKPQEYAKFGEGDPGFFSYLMSNRTRPIDAVISEYMKLYGKTAKEFKGFDGSDKSFLLGLLNIINANDEYVLPIRFTGGKSFDQVRSMPISSAVEFNPEYWDYYNQQSKPNNTSNTNVIKPTKPLWQPTKDNKTTHPEIDNVWSRHKTSDFVAAEPPVTTVPTVSKKKLETTVSKKGEASKPSSSKKATTTSRVTTSTVPQEEKLTPEQIAESLRIADTGERHWLRGSVTEPKQSFTSLAKITPEKIKSQGVNNVAPLTGIKSSTDTTGTDSTGYTGSNWQDNLYRMAVLSQPLWDRAEAEPVNYESPVYKYMPTQIDVSSQLRDADQSYALSRYNFANLYPNTGAGMAAGLQAASNRAKQYADIRQWQTNAQNELIGKNVGIYNNWANEHARILNDVYNKSAQNRAAARNINRQNRAAWLSNWGTILRDDKQFAADSQNKELQTEALKPLIQSVYENSDTLIPMLAQYTVNKNIKKKSLTR